MKRLLAIGVSAVAVLTLSSFQASAGTPTDCLAQRHVCVRGGGRSLISGGQKAQLERQIGDSDIYLMDGPYIWCIGLQRHDESDNQLAERT